MKQTKRSRITTEVFYHSEVLEVEEIPDEQLPWELKRIDINMLSNY